VHRPCGGHFLSSSKGLLVSDAPHALSAPKALAKCPQPRLELVSVNVAALQDTLLARGVEGEGPSPVQDASVVEHRDHSGGHAELDEVALGLELRHCQVPRRVRVKVWLNIFCADTQGPFEGWCPEHARYGAGSGGGICGKQTAVNSYVRALRDNVHGPRPGVVNFLERRWDAKERGKSSRPPLPQLLCDEQAIHECRFAPGHSFIEATAVKELEARL
jgi:hypothetical protein